VSAFRRAVFSIMPNDIIKLTDERAAQVEQAAPAASNVAATVGATSRLLICPSAAPRRMPAPTARKKAALSA